MKNKKPRADWKGFCEHVDEYDKLGIGWGINDLIRLSKIYHTPIPKKYRKGDLLFLKVSKNIKEANNGRQHNKKT